MTFKTISRFVPAVSSQVRARVAALVAIATAGATSAHAAFDTAAIDAAKADLLSAGAAILALSVAVWGAWKLISKFR